MYYLLLKYIHVVGATVIIGSGLAIASFLVMAHFTREVRLIAHVARIVALANLVFATTAMTSQPITGLLLMIHLGFMPNDGWIAMAIILYVIAGAFWVPILLLQVRMRRLAEAALEAKTELGADYQKAFRLWVLLCIPAFSAVFAILWLMLTKIDTL